MNISNVIRKLHDKGISNTDIAQILEVPRQRVWDVLNSRKPKEGKLEKVNGLMTISEVASFLGIHSNTARRWANEGAIKVYRIGSRRDRRFRLEDVQNLIKGNYPLTTGKSVKNQ